MKFPSFVTKFAAVAALTVGLTQTAAFGIVNLVLDGGFEDVVATSWTTGAISGWTKSNNSFVGTVSPHTGDNGLRFGNQVGGITYISQTLTTVVGETYALDFWLWLNNSGTSVFNVSWGGNLVPALTLTDASPFDWTQFTATGLIATSTSTTIQFGFRHDTSHWRIDDIAVVATPDGGLSVGLLAMAMATLVGVRRWMR